jgi:hypothetical protein
MNALAPGSVAPVSTNSALAVLGDRTLRSSKADTATKTTRTTAAAMNHLRFDRPAGGRGSVNRCVAS